MDEGSTSGQGWQAGMNLLTAGKANEAIAVLQQAAQNQPDNFEANNYLGVALAQSGRFEEAISALQKATRLNAQSAQARFNLGLAFEGAGRTDAARNEFQSALQLDPKYAAATHAISRLDALQSTPLATPSTSAASPWASGEGATQQMGAQQQAEIERLAKPHVLNVLGGLAAGFVAAIICAVLWDKIAYYTSMQFGYAAIGVGFVVGTAVVAGAGKKYGLVLQILSGLLSLFGIFLGQTLLMMDLIRDEIVKNPQYSAAQISSFDIFFVSMMGVPSFLKDNPLSVLFLLIGLWAGWSAPAKPKEETFPEATATDAAPAPAVIANAPIDAPAAMSTPSANAPLDGPPRA